MCQLIKTERYWAILSHHGKARKSNKSILLHNNTKDNNPIIFQNHHIHNLPHNKTLRFLGTYIDHTKQNSVVAKQLLKLFNQQLSKLKYSHITEKQAIYIINVILLAQFKY